MFQVDFITFRNKRSFLILCEKKGSAASGYAGAREAVNLSAGAACR
ncbi:hypothetical protein [Cronobacter sakazakii]|nr:hypothetical protein [Cronobacter sakazakii]